MARQTGQGRPCALRPVWGEVRPPKAGVSGAMAAPPCRVTTAAMPLVLDKDALRARLAGRELALIDAMADGFAALARGEVVVPPVGHLDFKDRGRLLGD